MKIGAIKLYLPLFVNNNELKSTGYTEEVFDFLECFTDNKDVCYILSPCDNDYSTNILNYWLNSSLDFIKKLDVLFIFNSKISCQPTESNDTKRLFYSEVEKYKKIILELKKEVIRPIICYIVTDLDCYDYWFAFNSDYVFSQSAANKLGNYCAIEKCFAKREIINLDKKYKLTYIGNERKDRLDKFYEYFVNNEYLYLVGNFTKFKVDRERVDFNTAQDILKKSKYSLVLSDESYSQLNFLTPRLFECISSGALTFIDIDYDRQELLNYLPELIVSCKYELLSKIEYYENNSDEYKKMLQKQKVFYEKQYNIANKIIQELKGKLK